MICVIQKSEIVIKKKTLMLRASITDNNKSIFFILLTFDQYIHPYMAIWRKKMEFCF